MAWPLIAWRWLIGVPDRPRASAGERFLRAAPIAAPVLAVAVLAFWRMGIVDPAERAARAAQAPLLALNAQNDILGLACSDRTASELLTEAEQARRSLAASPQAIDPALATFRGLAAANGWSADLQPARPAEDSNQHPGQIGWMEATATLRPNAGNTHPWTSLLPFLDALSKSAQQLVLTRLVVRADEQGRYLVETRIRIPYLFINETLVK
jgi:hypothetical protein